MRTALDGLHDGALRLHLAAPPVDGKANQRLIVWLAAELGRAQRALRIAHRESSRRKTVEIDAVAERVLRWLDASSVASPREPPVSTSDEGPT